MSDAANKEQVEAPVAEVPAAQEVPAPATEDAKMEDTPAAVVEAPAATETSEDRPAAVAESGEAPKEGQNGDAKPEKADGQQQRTQFKNNRKYDPASQPVTDDPIKIRNQVEFYFGDSNLPMDKFMWEQTGGTENKPVPLKTICNFSRMRRFQPYSAVVAALTASGFLEVSGEEGEEMIKRKKAYVSSSDTQKKKVAQSVYIKGFGEEEASTQFDIEAWISNYGTVNHVKLRRKADDSTFKGSIFVEFHTEELAKAFVALDPKPTWKGNELKIMMKKEYLDEKTRMIQAGEMEPSKHHKPTFFEGREKGGKGRGGGRGGNQSRKDDNNRNNGFNGRGGGRGGRGRGRGNRGGRGGRGRDDRERRDDKHGAAPKSTNNVTPPTIQATDANGKRAREDDGTQGPAAKKVDVKPEAAAAAAQ